MDILALYDTMDLPETELIKLVSQQGFSVDVICNPAGGFFGRLKGTSIAVEHLVCRNRLDHRAIRYIYCRLRTKKYDIVHAFTARTLSASLFASAVLRHKPKIIAYRGALGNVGRFDPTSWITYRHPRVSCINCVSDAVQDSLLKAGISASRLVRIYKGHQTSWYQPEQTADLTQWGIPQNAFVVTCVANMRPNKGVEILVQAANLLADFKEIYFLIVGDIRYEAIQRLAEKSPAASRVHFTGVRKDVPAILAASKLFVMPTRFTEGLPKAVIEAMSLEVPPIVTKVGGMVELVRNEIDGLVVEPSNPEAIAQAVLRLFQDSTLRQKLAKAAKARIEEDFNIVQTVEQTCKMYREIVSVHARSH